MALVKVVDLIFLIYHQCVSMEIFKEVVAVALAFIDMILNVGQNVLYLGEGGT